MPHCENCGTKWSWVNLLKIGFQTKRKCATCNKMQYAPSGLDRKLYIPMLIIMFIAPLAWAYLEIPDLAYVLFFIILSLLAIIFSPYTIKLHNRPKQTIAANTPSDEKG
ncbi:TIGR04104 family putative zinc finger protein [Planococcus sp. CP5-4_UN]|uniref:TIGR04104 family putative zinc finger protein n=1 Tax=unclassified Planococcus (in: firmicutes) TaxID=2662419 RepID=UPI0020B7DFC5|nr:TIGR04104 family putative zinc finger protein [Planococcus sp. CP5-4_UN]